MKRISFLLFLMLSSVAWGTISVRQHADTIVNDKKILASDLNDEFDELTNAVNSIDSTNITDGSLTATDFAATSTAVSLNARRGCSFSRTSDITGNKLVSIKPPCEIFMDGVRGYITATADISLLSNLLDLDVNSPLATANYYFIYASMNSGSLSFSFSQTQPTLATARKRNNSSFRYIGTVRTGDATQDIAAFTQLGNMFYWSQGDTSTPQANLIATGTTVSSSPTIAIPNHWNNVMFRYQAYVAGFPAQCRFNVSGIRNKYQAIVEATGGHTGVIPFWVPVAPSSGSASLSLQIDDIKNCYVNGDVSVIGWSEPLSLFQ